MSSSSQVPRFKRARLLFDSLIKSNPKHATWMDCSHTLGGACQQDGCCTKAHKTGLRNLSENRGCMARRCKATCKKYHNSSSGYSIFDSNEDAKVILANLVQHAGLSINIWLSGAHLEQDAKDKKRVLRKGTSMFAFIISSLRKYQPWNISLIRFVCGKRQSISKRLQSMPVS